MVGAAVVVVVVVVVGGAFFAAVLQRLRARAHRHKRTAGSRLRIGTTPRKTINVHEVSDACTDGHAARCASAKSAYSGDSAAPSAHKQCAFRPHGESVHRASDPTRVTQSSPSMPQ